MGIEFGIPQDPRRAERRLHNAGIPTTYRERHAECRGNAWMTGIAKVILRAPEIQFMEVTLVGSKMCDTSMIGMLKILKELMALAQRV